MCPARHQCSLLQRVAYVSTTSAHRAAARQTCLQLAEPGKVPSAAGVRAGVGLEAEATAAAATEVVVGEEAKVVAATAGAGKAR